MGKFLFFLYRWFLLPLALVWTGPPASPASVPLPPSNLSAAPFPPARIYLTWDDNSSNEAGFKIERWSVDTSGWQQIGMTSTGNSSFDDLGRSCGIPYFYRVLAFNGSGDSDYSNVATTTIPCPPDFPPTGLSAEPVAPAQIDLSWTDNSSNEGGFEIERSPDGVSSWAYVGIVTANITSYHHSNIACDITHYYRVRAVNTGGVSGYSNVASATTACILDPPTNLSATPISAAQIDLAWLDNSLKESGYRVERFSSGGTWLELAELPAGATVYRDMLLTCNTPYTYRVYAFNAGGNSPFSNEAAAVTWHCLPAAPSELHVSPVPGSPVNLTWKDNSSDEIGFTIERSIDGGSGWEQVGTVSLGITTYSDASTTPGVRYFYRVAAYNETGGSGYSNVASTALFVYIPFISR